MALDLISVIGGTTDETAVKQRNNAAVIGVAQQAISNAEQQATAQSTVASGATDLALALQEANAQLTSFAAQATKDVNAKTAGIQQNVGVLREMLEDKYTQYVETVARDVDLSFWQNPIAKVRTHFQKRDLESDMTQLTQAANAGVAQINTEYMQAARQIADNRAIVAATKFNALERQQVAVQSMAQKAQIEAAKQNAQLQAAGIAIDKQQFVVPRAGSADTEYDKLLENPVLRSLYRASNNGSMAGWNKDFAVIAATKFERMKPEQQQVWADVAMRTGINAQLQPNPGEPDAEFGRRWLNTASTHIAQFAGPEALPILAEMGSSAYNGLLRTANDLAWRHLSSNIPEGLEPKETTRQVQAAQQQLQNMRPAEKLRFVGLSINADMNNRNSQQNDVPLAAAAVPILAADLNLDANVREFLGSEAVRQSLELPNVVTGKKNLDTTLDLLDKLQTVTLSTGKTITVGQAAEIVAKLFRNAYVSDYEQNGDFAEELSLIKPIAPDVQLEPTAYVTYKGNKFNILDTTDILALRTRTTVDGTRVVGPTMGITGGFGVPQSTTTLRAADMTPEERRARTLDPEVKQDGTIIGR